MKYVLDPNVALKWVLPEQDDEKAIRIRMASQVRCGAWMSSAHFSPSPAACDLGQEPANHASPQHHGATEARPAVMAVHPFRPEWDGFAEHCGEHLENPENT